MRRGLTRPSAEDSTFFEHIIIEVALSRCWGVRDEEGRLVGTRHWFRILPSDVLPHKRYSVAAHEAVLQVYSYSWQSLRTVADEFVRNGPTYVTVWRWSGGVGSWALGRNPVEAASAFSAVKAETGKRLCVEEAVEEAWNEPVAVPTERYGIERRKDELTALSKVLSLATIVTQAAGHAGVFVFSFWVQFLFSLDTPRDRANDTALRISFWGTSPFTPMKLSPGKERVLGLRRKEERWTPTRSPPGGTNK